MQVSCQYLGHVFICSAKGSEIITFCKQSSVLSPVSTSRFVNIPEPAGKVAPENENERTVLLPAADIANPTSAADPPEPPLTVAPYTSN